MTDKPESFKLDHDAVIAPYLRKAGTHTLQGGGEIIKWDVRFKQPNSEHLEMAVIHSIEHSLATTLRQISNDVVDISPMGCQTGFYITVDGAAVSTFNDFSRMLKKGIELVLGLDEVPGSTRKECGWAESHDLEGAKEALTEFLKDSDNWHSVFRAEG